MSTEITEGGYEDLRTEIAERWNHIGIHRGSQELFRLPVDDPGDPRVTSVLEPPYVRYQIQLTGGDPEIKPNLPVDVDGLALYADATDPAPTSPGTFEPFTFEAPLDTLTLTHSIKLPSEGVPGPPGRDGHSVNVFQQADDPKVRHDPGQVPERGDFWIMPNGTDVRIMMPDGNWESLFGPMLARIATLAQNQQQMLETIQLLQEQLDDMPTYVGDDSINIT